MSTTSITPTGYENSPWFKERGRRPLSKQVCSATAPFLSSFYASPHSYRSWTPETDKEKYDDAGNRASAEGLPCRARCCKHGRYPWAVVFPPESPQIQTDREEMGKIKPRSCPWWPRKVSFPPSLHAAAPCRNHLSQGEILIDLMQPLLIRARSLGIDDVPTRAAPREVTDNWEDRAALCLAPERQERQSLSRLFDGASGNSSIPRLELRQARSDVRHILRLDASPGWGTI